MVVIIIYFICSNQSGKYQVKDMNVYTEPLIDKLQSYGITSLCMMYLDQYRNAISIPCNSCMDNT